MMRTRRRDVVAALGCALLACSMLLSACSGGGSPASLSTVTAEPTPDPNSPAARLAPLVATVSTSRAAVLAALAEFRHCYDVGGKPCTDEAAYLAGTARPLLALGPTVPEFAAGPTSTATPAESRQTPPPATNTTANLVQNTYSSAHTIIDLAPKVPGDCADLASLTCASTYSSFNDAALVLEGNMATWGNYVVPATARAYVLAIDEYRDDVLAAARAFESCYTKTPGTCAEQRAAVTAVVPMIVLAVGTATAPPPGTRTTISSNERRIGPPPASLVPLVDSTVGASYRVLDTALTSCGGDPTVACPAGEKQLAAALPELVTALQKWSTVASD